MHARNHMLVLGCSCDGASQFWCCNLLGVISFLVSIQTYIALIHLSAAAGGVVIAFAVIATILQCLGCFWGYELQSMAYFHSAVASVPSQGTVIVRGRTAARARIG